VLSPTLLDVHALRDCDAPPNSLKDSNANPKMKRMEKKVEASSFSS
jgi:hypothetical protein